MLQALDGEVQLLNMHQLALSQLVSCLSHLLGIFGIYQPASCPMLATILHLQSAVAKENLNIFEEHLVILRIQNFPESAHYTRLIGFN